MTCLVVKVSYGAVQGVGGGFTGGGGGLSGPHPTTAARCPHGVSCPGSAGTLQEGGGVEAKGYGVLFSTDGGLFFPPTLDNLGGGSSQRGVFVTRGSPRLRGGRWFTLSLWPMVSTGAARGVLVGEGGGGWPDAALLLLLWSTLGGLQMAAVNRRGQGGGRPGAEYHPSC